MGTRKPYDAEVEYLEVNKDSGGQPYILTDYVPTGKDIMIHAVFTFLGYRDSAQFTQWFVAYTADGGPETYRAIRGSDADHILVNNGGRNNDYASVNVISGTTYDIKLDGNTATINGTRYTMQNNSNAPNTGAMRLFAVGNEANPNRTTYGRFHSFTMAKGGVTVLDMIPVRKGGEGFMYDKVSGKLYGNVNTGRFILGPDVAKQSVNNQLVKRGGG